jgi:hypothetical protein
VTTKLQTLIKAVQELSPLEQLNLISAVSQSLYYSYQQMPPQMDFWKPPTLEQLIQAQQTQPITDIASLRGAFWPEDETADDLIEYIYQQRHEDRLGDN